MSTEFASSGGTRNIEAGDTPGLDYLGVSVAMGEGENLTKGTPCFIVGGFVVTAATTENGSPTVPVVPTESIDNSAGLDGDLEIRVILPNQPIALTAGGPFTVGQYATIVTDGIITALSNTATNTTRKFARYMGKEAAVFSIDSTTPFDQSLSTGIVPDQSLALDEVGWFMLVESAL